MPDFQGKFQYLAPSGATSQGGACRLHFDAQTLTLTPASGAALAFDLGDLDAVTAADYEVRLPLYTGNVIVLSQLAKSYDNLVRELTHAYRNRSVQCLLLEDMGEIARFDGNFELTGITRASGQAEIRLYKSNLAVLPAMSQSFQWRLADIDEVKLDAVSYEVSLQSGDQCLKISCLAKRTEEFAARVSDARNALATSTAQVLHSMLPFLDPDQLQSCAALLIEGRSAPLAKLAAIHEKIPAALAANAIDKDLKPYYDQLVARAVGGMGYAGLKLMRLDDEDSEAASKGADGHSPASIDHSAGPTDQDAPDHDAPDKDAGAPETLHWFFFPLAAKPGSTTLSNVVAWEANSRAGRASYFFRLVAPEQAAQLAGLTLADLTLADPALASSVVDSAIRRLNRVLAMLNFSRRPIYLSEDELAMSPRFHRYAIAARRLPELREVRSSFLGRALHSSLEAWQEQVDSIIRKA
jgi:hypothetical protein